MTNTCRCSKSTPAHAQRLCAECTLHQVRPCDVCGRTTWWQALSRLEDRREVCEGCVVWVDGVEATANMPM